MASRSSALTGGRSILRRSLVDWRCDDSHRKPPLETLAFERQRKAARELRSNRSASGYPPPAWRRRAGLRRLRRRVALRLDQPEQKGSPTGCRSRKFGGGCRTLSGERSGPRSDKAALRACRTRAARPSRMRRRQPKAKKPLKATGFQGLVLVAGAGFEPATFRL